MATVSSFTAAHILELIDGTFAGASVNGAGNLILTTKGGASQDLGPIIPGGAVDQYYRGDKSWATLNKSAVGLSLVDNVSVLSDYTPKWKTGTVYAVGTQVITPNNLVMKANAAHTASASFITDIGKWDGLTTDVPYGHMGRTAAFQALNGVHNIVSMDVAQELRGGMTFDNATDSLVVPATGRYRAHLKGYFSGSTSSVNYVGLYLNGVRCDGTIRSGVYEKLASSVEKNTSADTYLHSTGIVPFNAGDKVALDMYSGVSAWGSNGYNGSYLELEYVGGA